MLLHANGWPRPPPTSCSSSSSFMRQSTSCLIARNWVNIGRRRSVAFASFSGLALSLSILLPNAASLEQEPESETLSNIPQELSGECPTPKDCRKPRIQRPKTRKAESCTTKCVTTCIRGGEGSPGEGPLNIRKPLVVFKEGFRSRRYCLVECSDICNLLGDEDSGP
ncbi:hypothetical protein SAY86_013773 [Trapa natans]|uniref:Uncharacterized protein n=1 Tax=Trapa natans TaxID=22666 RepID=A0AAN7KX11_TRANT|nr:hypothetical protein SAY86_013773 [Trapa natans]